MIFVGWLVLASRSPKMDASTMKMPMGMRSMVADGVLQAAKYGKVGTRSVRLDPGNAAAWSRLCNLEDDSAPAAEAIRVCRTAISLDSSADNWDSLGIAQQQTGDHCAAEDSFTKASSITANNPVYSYVENMGRAALRCGAYYDARAGLETAIELEEKNIQDTKNWEADDIAGFKQDQQEDREYLVVTFDRLHEAKLQKDTCSLAHPGWSGCACKLDEKGDVSCSESR